MCLKESYKVKILHVGAHPSLNKVDGLNTTVWLVASEQAKIGHQVTLLFNSAPDKTAIEFAEKTGMCLVTIPNLKYGKFTFNFYQNKLIENLLQESNPDIVHMHNVFLPKQALLAKILSKYKLPYLITPHALTPQFLQRNQLKKKLYSFLVERPRFMGAAAIVGVSPGEEKTIRKFVPRYGGKICSILNPIDSTTNLETSPLWRWNPNKKNLVYLGRFDVWHKGIDILIAIAYYLPANLELHLYGTEAGKHQEWLSQLKNQSPHNVHFHAPVFGREKTKVLSEAMLYIQASRWEVFGLSIAESMCLGVPCAIAETLCLSEILRDNDLGLVLSSNPKQAASQIIKIINQPEILQSWSERGFRFAKANFAPLTVASQYLNLYREILQKKKHHPFGKKSGETNYIERFNNTQ